MRWLLLVLTLLGGCAQTLEVVARSAVDTAVDNAVDHAMRRPNEVGVIDAHESFEVVQRRAAYARVQDAQRLWQARTLTRTAVAAARVGDCDAVVTVEQQILALPDDAIEGGVHDMVFLREPIIVRCLAAHRALASASNAARAGLCRDAARLDARARTLVPAYRDRALLANAELASCLAPTVVSQSP